MNEIDIIVVGSGPAGVSAALPLVETGRRVLMLDGGEQSDATFHAPSRLLGPDLEGLSVEDGLSPKLRTPEARLALEAFGRVHGIEADNFLAVGSIARGGLSRVWGAFVAEFDAADLEGWPVGRNQLSHSYRRVTERIGISGTVEDAAGRLLGDSGPLQPPLPLGQASRALLQRYRNEGKFVLGQARNALLSRPIADRSACDLRSGCLWGCPIGAIYDARQDLKGLIQHTNFRIAERAEVVNIEKVAAGWCAHTTDGRSFIAPKLILAAGTLGSTRLVAPLLDDMPEWRLLSNPVLASPMLVPKALRAGARTGHDLAQLSFFLPIRPGSDSYVSGAVYETQGLPASNFASQGPLGRRAGEALFRFLSPALLAAITYFPGAFSNNRLRFDRPSGKLHITGGFAEGFVRTAREVSNDLARHWRALGAIALSRARLAMPGVDAHFVGTLPMGGRAANGTSSSGELSGFSGLHIVDGSVLPTLPSKHATLTIMANADRIGTLLSTG